MAPAGNVVDDSEVEVSVELVSVELDVGPVVDVELESPPGGKAAVPQAAAPMPTTRMSSAARETNTIERCDMRDLPADGWHA
jgi:hypothetical protein